jgi:hypothetical protein
MPPQNSNTQPAYRALTWAPVETPEIIQGRAEFHLSTASLDYLFIRMVPSPPDFSDLVAQMLAALYRP